MTFVKFFYCEHNKQRMAKVVCLQFQTRAKIVGASRAGSLDKCFHCAQGEEIVREVEAEKKARGA